MTSKIKTRGGCPSSKNVSPKFVVATISSDI
jgi:hypothetical protein